MPDANFGSSVLRSMMCFKTAATSSTKVGKRNPQLSTFCSVVESKDFATVKLEDSVTSLQSFA
eukprot:CAMPEP_0206425132 /NCGR_PEP_ID=MMETSP0324_2-20121206/3624_1 /ASSEMBLY_ACC=CAM_ASM_000836 /TAXON_ID=2866 /ORGANISM="Crypthecodinium cohnii, Strain Seligo" /LENGTH=62 /DNA_ID=CAMNT_0053889885 /DNA_START=605 /DNA_END=793 /DNA_ORIENTATION=-